jgi:predicted nucleic acid binding AN1-type Zn finger protein
MHTNRESHNAKESRGDSSARKGRSRGGSSRKRPSKAPPPTPPPIFCNYSDCRNLAIGKCNVCGFVFCAEHIRQSEHKCYCDEKHKPEVLADGRCMTCGGKFCKAHLPRTKHDCS